VDGVATSAITAQVLPEVARLVTRGDGTQRLTVKLNPEALGEVRIVLTVRNGDVHVRMTGSDAAHQALLNGAPELQRLLERAGAGSSQVVVGDVPAANQGTDRGSYQGQQHRDHSQPFGAQDGTANDAGRHHSNHRTAGTRDGSTSATDGAAGGTRPRSSPDPAAGIGGVTHTRLAGVDVTM
jgi:flagellar hook-length control protein FliK